VHDLKIAVIGIPGKWSSEVLADALAKRTGYRLLIDMAEVSLDLRRNTLVAGDVDLGALDGIVVKKISTQYSPNTIDRLELLRMAEHRGVRVFSGAEQMLRLVNRLSCTVTMRKADIPMPDTVITESLSSAVATVRDFGSAVFKPLFSTKARGMCIIDSTLSDSALRTVIAEFQASNPTMYIQRKIALPGRDLGLAFLGGEFLACYARVNQGDAWNTTIHSGGRYEAYTPPQALIDLAHRAQAPFKMDFTTVDIAETDTGPMVFEVSAFGGFRGVKEGAGIDAAAAYSDYILKELRR
jgi:ribosomal protein S6--L-glutamate ligase